MSFNRIPEAQKKERSYTFEYCKDRWNTQDVRYKGKTRPVIDVERKRHEGKIADHPTIRFFQVIEDLDDSDNPMFHRVEKKDGAWVIKDSQKHLKDF